MHKVALGILAAWLAVSPWIFGAVFATEEDSVSPAFIATLQKQYQGRVVGITPQNCREVNAGVFSTSECLQEDGTWLTGKLVDVQILTKGKVTIVTVDTYGPQEKIVSVSQ